MRERSADGVGGRAIGRVLFETAALRARRGRDFVEEEEVRARSPLAFPEFEWEPVPGRLVLKFVFISLEALESPKAILFTGFIGLVPKRRGFMGKPPFGLRSRIREAFRGPTRFLPVSRHFMP